MMAIQTIKGGRLVQRTLLETFKAAFSL